MLPSSRSARGNHYLERQTGFRSSLIMISTCLSIVSPTILGPLEFFSRTMTTKSTRLCMITLIVRRAVYIHQASQSISPTVLLTRTAVNESITNNKEFKRIQTQLFLCTTLNESITTNKEFKHIQTRLFLGPHERQDYTLSLIHI